MTPYVAHSSIVRKIWGRSDTILFIFAGAAAEFALNKAVDWLYFTGRLPADPIGRLFSTVSYARQIVFSSKEEAEKAIDKITAIHSGIEKARGAAIPGWAYRDVLFMLIYYSIAAFELMERKLTEPEKESIYQVFFGIGNRMQIGLLPLTYQDWLPVRATHMKEDLVQSKYTHDLFLQYKKHLGSTRYRILKEAQKLVLPGEVMELLRFRKFSFLSPLVPVYKISRRLGWDWFIKAILLPAAYHQQIKELDTATPTD